MKTPLLVALALLATLPATGAGPAPEGYWTGAIELPDQKLEIMVDIERSGETWRAAFYAPAQGIRGAGLTGIEIRDRSVSFRIPLTPGEPTFHGKLSEDGGTLSGDFIQAGETRAFRLVRSEKPAELEVDIYAEFREPGVPGEGLDATWRALLGTGLHHMRLELKVWKREGGAYWGSIDSLDQGTMGVHVDSFVLTDDTLSFQLWDIGAEYLGKVREDGSEVTGTWRQAGQEFPLTFKRKPGT